MVLKSPIGVDKALLQGLKDFQAQNQQPAGSGRTNRPVQPFNGRSLILNDDLADPGSMQPQGPHGMAASGNETSTPPSGTPAAVQHGQGGAHTSVIQQSSFVQRREAAIERTSGGTKTNTSAHDFLVQPGGKLLKMIVRRCGAPQWFYSL